jgi:hypothetical protein
MGCIIEDVLPQNSAASVNQRNVSEPNNQIGFRKEIPPFVKQAKMNLIKTPIGTSQVSLRSGILTFKF